MRYLSISITILALCTILGCQVGCGGDDDYTQEVGEPLIDPEPVPEELFKTAGYVERWEGSRAALKRYFKTKHTRPEVALQAYIEYTKWMYEGHELSEQLATITVKMDMAGKSNIPDTLEMLAIDLQMVKDIDGSQEHIEELETEILFWTELSEELLAEGEDPAEFVIKFSIGKGLD